MDSITNSVYVMSGRRIVRGRRRTASEVYGLISERSYNNEAMRVISVPIILMDEGYQRFKGFCNDNEARLRHKAKQYKNKMCMLYQQYFNRLELLGKQDYCSLLDEMDRLQEIIKSDLDILRYTILGTLMDIESISEREAVAELLMINYCTAMASGFAQCIGVMPDDEMPRLLRLTRELTIEISEDASKPTMYVNERAEEMITQSVNILINKFRDYSRYAKFKDGNAE